MPKMEFKTQYSPHDHFYTNSGDCIHKIYSGVVDRFGHMELEVSGEVNIYDEIQSHADSVDIHVILARYANGELDVLNQRSGFFGDVTEVPKTYAEMLNLVIKSENEFNQLPVDVRAKFNHNLNEFLAQAGTKEWAEKLGMVQPDVAFDSLKEEVKSDEP